MVSKRLENEMYRYFGGNSAERQLWKAVNSWRARADVTLRELVRNGDDVESILASSNDALTPKNITACSLYRNAIVGALREAISVRERLDTIPRQYKWLFLKQCQQDLEHLRDNYWDIFNVHCRAIVPPAYFAAMLPYMNEIMLVLKHRKKIKPNKKQARRRAAGQV